MCMRAVHVCVCVCVCVVHMRMRVGGGRDSAGGPFPHLSLQPSCFPFHGQMRQIIGPKASQVRGKMSTGLGNEKGANTIPSTWK